MTQANLTELIKHLIILLGKNKITKQNYFRITYRKQYTTFIHYTFISVVEITLDISRRRVFNRES